MIPLAEAVMQTEAILEEWIPKEQLQEKIMIFV